MSNDATADRAFTLFVRETEPGLRFALAAAYGFEVGTEAAADALAWAWEHWDEVQRMRNPGGYLYRVGQSKARRYQRPIRLFPPPPPRETSGVDPELPNALKALSPRQRAAVVLIHGFGYSTQAAADLLGMSRRSVRTHAQRALIRLEKLLEVSIDA